MASVLRRPFAITSALRQVSKPSPITTRAFHQIPKPFSPNPSIQEILKAQKPVNPITRFTSAQYAFKRTYMQPAQGYSAGSGELRTRLLYGAAMFGGTIVAINFIFNRETREDGGMPPFERSYLNDTFVHTGLGVGIIGMVARGLHQSGMSLRIMSANPWLVVIGGLAASIGSMYATFSISPDNYIPKYAAWATFNATQALIISPLMFMQPALLLRAGLYTVAMMGSIAFVGATAKTDKYLYLGGPLLAGVAIVAVSGFAPLVLPVTAARTLAITENIWLWGGLAVFGGFTLYDVQKILHHARMAERGLLKRDPVNESISLELDFLNIFIRMVQIMGMSQRRK